MKMKLEKDELYTVFPRRLNIAYDGLHGTGYNVFEVPDELVLEFERAEAAHEAAVEAIMAYVRATDPERAKRID